MFDFSRILAETNSLVVQVGEFILEEFNYFDKSKIEVKGLNQLVSYVDVEAEKKLVSGLKRILPVANYITEENTIEQAESEFVWIIDPLDGTTNFTHHLPIFSISVALMHNQEIILGCIYELGRKELFTARKGAGAWCNGKEIKVSNSQNLKESLLATGFPYHDFGKIDQYLNLLKQLMKSSHGLRRMGSAAVDLAYTAAGRFDGFYEIGLNAWDVAAGCLIVQEAGGIVTDFNSKNNYLFGKEIIATNHNIYEELIETIQQNII